MATYYSDQYGAPPNAELGAAAAQIYRGPTCNYAMTKGGVYVVRGTLVIPTGDTFGAGDVAKLLDAAQSAKLLRIALIQSGDLNAANDFTFNLGWASAGATAHASASTGLQGTTPVELSAATLAAAVAAAAHGDSLVLTRVAGALAAGSVSFIAELTH